MTFDLLTWISIGIICLSRTINIPSLKPEEQSLLELSVARGETDWHDLWPTDLNINRGHLLIKDYLRTKFEACGAKHSWVISCTKLKDTDIPTYRPTDMCKAICPSFFKGGIINHDTHLANTLYTCSYDMIRICLFTWALKGMYSFVTRSSVTYWGGLERRNNFIFSLPVNNRLIIKKRGENVR